MTEALLDRLAHLAAVNREARPLYNAEIPSSGTTREDLDYEDWTQPMQLSGGRIGAMWICETRDVYGFVRWEPDGLVFSHGETVAETGPAAVDAFRQVVHDGHFRAEPLLDTEIPDLHEDHA